MIDIRKGVLYPEIQVDARVVTATEGGTEVASYSGFKPFIAQLKELATSRNARTTVRVSVDGAAEVISAATLARYDYDVPEELDLTTLSSLAITLASDVGTGPIAGQIVRHAMKITKPTVYERIKLGMRLSDEEKDFVKATHRVYLSADHQSVIHLGVLPGPAGIRKVGSH